MREFQAKRKAKRALYSKISVAVLLVLVILLARGTWGIYQKERESRANIDIASSQLRDIQARHDLLKSDIDHLKTPAGQEEVIREKYQVAKEGENVVVIINSTSTQTIAPTAAKATSTPSNGFWGAFSDFFR